MYKYSNNLVPDYISVILPPLIGKVLTILYVTDTILQACILVQKYLANLAFLHLNLTGIILIMTVESLTDMFPFAAYLEMMLKVILKFPPIS